MMLKIVAAVGLTAAALIATPANAGFFDCRGDGCKLGSDFVPAARPLFGAIDNGIARFKGEQGSQGLPGGPIGEPARPSAPAAPQMSYMPPPPPPTPVGAFCYVAGGRFGPGPIQPLGAPCNIMSPMGPVWGQVGI